jgi:ATP-dependent Clp protease ATP-binding subunit ClpB
MTSNIGSAEIQLLSSAKAEQWEVEAKIKDMLKEYFRPEFLNRIDEIILFHSLSREQLTRIVDVQLEQLRKRLTMRGLKLQVSPEAKELLAEEGYDPQYGARPLKRVIQQRIENSLASHILRGEFVEGDVIYVGVNRAKHEFTFEKRREAVEGEIVEEAAQSR